MSAAVSPVPHARDRRNHQVRNALIVKVRREFSDMPCMRLTAPQVRRLFALRSDVCRRILGELVREGTLTCGSDERYSLNPARVNVRSAR